MNEPAKDTADPHDAAFTDESGLTAEGVDELDRLRREAAEGQDRALRAHAELENVRRRTRRELDERLKYALMPLVEELLPVVDNVARAIEAAEKTSEAASLLAGFKMVAQQLEGALERHHCRRIAALHQPFDPNLHAALMQQPSEEFAAGTVLQVLQAGFQLHDRVVRPSQVIVSTGSAKADSESAAAS